MKKKVLVVVFTFSILAILTFGIVHNILDNQNLKESSNNNALIKENDNHDNENIDNSNIQESESDETQENNSTASEEYKPENGIEYELNSDGSIYFEDENLKKAIEKNTNKINITPTEAAEIDILLLSEKNIKSIKGLEFFTSLTVLDLDYNYISDLQVLKKLDNLKYLSLHSNNISDITPLATLKNLEFLAISSNKITDVSSLVDLKKLHYFPSMYNNNILNIEVLEDNIKIYYENLKKDYYQIDVSNGGFSYIREFGNIVAPYCIDGEKYTDCMARYTYDMDIQNMKTYKASLSKAREFIKENIKDEMTDLEKEIVIINYLVKNMYYETTDGIVDGTNDLYYPLVLGYGQCHNYAQAFNLLAYLAGLESYSAFAGAAHEWNIVKINGEYYHLDITWADSGEEVNYMYINLSTETMNELHGAIYVYTPTDILNISKKDMNFH